MTPHSSENLMERASLSEQECADAIKALAKRFGSDNWMGTAPEDMWNTVAHAQRVKMAQEVVAEMREAVDAHMNRGLSQMTAQAVAFGDVLHALQAQLEAEVRNGK